MINDEATIAAIATPPGAGGIGIIRISGALALPVLQKIFKPRQKQAAYLSKQMYYGWIISADSPVPIDEVLVVYMKSPATYTREDVVEIHSHGSFIVLQEILDLLLRQGIRLADPGEFTKRAFLNGRIDLTQAEAVVELLQAKTRQGSSQAMIQLQGRLGSELINIRESFLALRAIIEVGIDFPEEDVEIINPEVMAQQVTKECIEPLQQLIERSEHGKIYSEGISVIILGRPNVGKSSLLNGLLKEERAIVTAMPGTTRDTIEEYLDIKGIPVRIIDTAGIRKGADNIEEIGIKRARQKLESADLVLLLVDVATGIKQGDIELFKLAGDRKILLVLNKIDILPDFNPEEWAAVFPDIPIIPVSAKTLAGLPHLEQGIFAAVSQGAGWDPGHGSVPNVRQRANLAKTLEVAIKFKKGLTAGLPPDLLAIELQDGLDFLGEIVGETTTDDILDKIFKQFCLGK